MAYVMTYVAAVPTGKRADYERVSAIAAAVFKDHGATRVVECWGADVPPGEVTSFPLAVQAGPDETVVIGWQEWPSKAAQEAGMPKAMQDPRMAAMQDMPADGKRLIFGGFEVVLDI